jgi:hypothetical protein
MRRFCWTVLLCVLAGTMTQAQSRGEYSSGSTLNGAGTLPSQGFAYSNQLWYNSSDRLYGPNGVVPDPGSFFSLTDNNTVTYVPQFELLKAHLQFMVDIAFSVGRFSSKSPLTGDTVTLGDAGLSDTEFVPLDLGWNLKRVDLQAGLALYAPTGRYAPHASDNLSSGFWTLGPQLGVTVYLTKNKATQLSAYSYYAWNTRQSGTGVTPGQNYSLDYSVTRTFSFGKNDRWQLLAGPAGYGQWQTTNDSGRSQPPLRYAVNAVGFTTNFTLPYRGMYIGASILWEYGAQNTFEGRTSVITGGLNF